MTTATGIQYKVKGVIFGARGSSCSCDPCDCNPCSCGDDDGHHPQSRYPYWRISGYSIRAGKIQGVDVSHLVLLSLSLPAQEGVSDRWQHMLLVDHKATDEQVSALLTAFEHDLDSTPAEIERSAHYERAVYRTSIRYEEHVSRPMLHVTFTHDNMALIREGTDHTPREWIYDGPMALRGFLIHEH